MKKAFIIFLLCFNPAFAEPLTSDVTNGCDINNVTINTTLNRARFMAQFVPNTHTCDAGYFLPANTDGCRACPSGYTCTGGTFVFNEHQSQGINIKDYISKNLNYGCSDTFVPTGHMRAIFVPNDPDVITVYFNNNGQIETTTCDADGDLTLPETPTRVGYEFAGWKVHNND